MYRLLLLGTSIVCCLASHAHAQDAPEVSFEAAYIAEVWQNNGGAEDGDIYLDLLTASAEVELSDSWTAYGSVLASNGNSLNELTGDAMVVSNIESGIDRLQVFEAWLQGDLTSRTNLKVGLYDLNSEFDALDTSALFIGSAHGIGMDLGQTGENGPSIFPVVGLAVRVEQDLGNLGKVRFAVLDGVPGEQNDPSKTALDISSDEGALLIGELDAPIGQSSRILLGGWAYTESQNDISGGTSANQGLYIRGERTASLASGGELGLFARLGVAAGDVNDFSNFAAAGVTYTTSFDHQFGVAIARAGVGKKRQDIENLDDSETVFELTYVWPVNEYFSLQPNFQYVISPSADPTLDEASVLGLRFSAAIGN